MSNAARDAAYSENTRKALSLDAPAQGSSTLDAQDVSAGRAEGSSSVEGEVDAPEWEVPLAMLRDLYLPASALAGGTSIGATYPSPKTRSELENGSASRASSSPSSQRVSSAQDGSLRISSSSSSPIPAMRDTRPRTSSSLSQTFNYTSDEEMGSWHTLAGSPRFNRVVLESQMNRPPSAGNGRLRNDSQPQSVGLGVSTAPSSLPPSQSLQSLESTSSLRSLASSGLMSSKSRRDLMIQHSRSASWLPATRRLPEPERKRILVTGGAGFVGSHLVDRLLLMGHDVIVMDSFLTGARSNLEQWEGHRSFELLRHDVIEPILVEVDQIYHLACPASPRHYQANPIKTLKTNFLGTSNMLGLAKRTKSTLLLASTSEVYGDPQINPQREDYCGNTSCVGPRAAYDEGKRVAETLTNEYMKKDGVDTRIARIFNTYGPRMHAADGRVVSNFVIQALKGLPLTMYGDGIQTRSFCFIHDLIDGLIALMSVHPGEEGKDIHFPVNLGSSFEFTIAELATIVAEVVDELLAEERPKTEIRYLPLPIDDPKQRRPDTTRAEGLIGWNPRWKLKDGLREMAAYYHARILDGSL